MKSLLCVGLTAAALLAVPATGKTEDQAKASFSSCGTAYSVGGEEGSLLIQHRGEFSLIMVGINASIRDAKGRLMRFRDIRPGDWIEYWPEHMGEAVVTRRIGVNVRNPGECSAPTVLGQS